MTPPRGEWYPLPVTLEELLALAGRLLLATIFLASAFGKLTNFSATAQYMEAHGMPWPSLLCGAAVLVESAGGLALVLGFQSRWAAGGLAAFVAAATAIFHATPDQRIHLLKNLAIMGGLLEVAAFGPGTLSLEGRGRHRDSAANP